MLPHHPPILKPQCHHLEYSLGPKKDGLFPEHPTGQGSSLHEWSIQGFPAPVCNVTRPPGSGD